jgi:methylase of polypeptide subunit release factors
VLSDINESALQLARVNAKAAGVDATIAYSDLFDQLDGEFDLIVANPPYLNDPLERTYRHGGGALGSEPITSSKAGGLIGNRQRRF